MTAGALTERPYSPAHQFPDEISRVIPGWNNLDGQLTLHIFDRKIIQAHVISADHRFGWENNEIAVHILFHNSKNAPTGKNPCHTNTRAPKFALNGNCFEVHTQAVDAIF